jgi:Sugar (and other) transporter
MLSAVLGYVAFFAFGLGPGVWVCLAELFLNHIRGRAMSLATVVRWLAVSAVTAMFLSLIQMFSAPAVFLGYAFICAASFAYVWMRLPETKGRTLEASRPSGRMLKLDTRPELTYRICRTLNRRRTLTPGSTLLLPSPATPRP